MTPLRRTTAVAMTLAALLALAGCGSGGSSGKSVDLTGTVVYPPYEVSSAALTTTDGTPYSLDKDTTKALTLVFFGYTSCPDICPAVMSSIASGISRLDPKLQDQIQLVFVSTDPKRDTDAVLSDYVSRFSPNFVGLRGDIEKVLAFAKPLHIYVDGGEALPSGGYDPNSHGTQVFGINAQHEAQIFWGAETSPKQFADDFTFLVEKQPDELKGPNS